MFCLKMTPNVWNLQILSGSLRFQSNIWEHDTFEALSFCAICPFHTQWINGMVTSREFNDFILFIIILNTAIYAMVWPEQSVPLKRALESTNFVFTVIFILEAILKVIGLGPRAYWSDNWNVFDFVIVSISIIEFIFDLIANGGTNGDSNGFTGSALSALRSMRLMRAFKLLGKFDTMRRLFYLVLGSMAEVSVLTMLMGIFIFMFAALGMSLFGGTLIEYGDERSGRWRFDHFYWSWINVFMVISGDSWNEIMYDTGLWVVGVFKMWTCFWFSVL